MRVLILGGDGYLGWPAAMHLAGRGHEVCAVDSYLRRRLCAELDAPPLVELPRLERRAEVFEGLSGKKIEVRQGDACDYDFLSGVFDEFRPRAVVHLAEQPSAPYSMIDLDTAWLTLGNNLHSTLNLAHAVHEEAPECRIVKLGTMGEYGTPDIDIEEGWIDIEHKGRRDRFLFPRQASSLYHTTKIQDTDLLWFYVRTWDLAVSDLMQGPVYGVSTAECDLDGELGTHLSYDEVFGTVLNRFVAQAVAGRPLTVYGTGAQKRGYINLTDSLACIELAVENPAAPGELRVFNQFTETFSVNELAGKVAAAGRARGHAVEIEKVRNPRVEAEEHYYNPARSGLMELGLEPRLLTGEVLDGFFEAVERHADGIDPGLFVRGVGWRK